MSLMHDNVTRGAFGTPTVLIVDDEKLQRDQLVDCLSDLNIEIFQGANGEEALEIIESHSPNLVIMDIRMPVLDGVSTVDQLARRSGRTKIILMTGDPTSLKSAYDRRPDVFTIIEKPIPLRVLRRFVIDALGLAG